jgi:alpha-beta hydrolase superfamily lysophospholipase
VEVLEPSRLEKRLVGAVVKTVFFRGRRGGPWPLPDGTVPVAFRGNSGARLRGFHMPVADAKGLVVLVHPDRRYGKHWFVREGWLPWLAENGLEALAFDFPIYGESSGGSTYLHEDVLAACAEARRLRPAIPIHLVGLSLGAFACANAAPLLRDVEGMVLESPYPTFESWYQGRPGALRAANRLLGKALPRTYGRIDAGRNIAAAKPRRILVAASRDDEVTPAALTRQVAKAAPTDRTTYLEVGGPHLGLFRHPAYREAVLATLQGRAA